MKIIIGMINNKTLLNYNVIAIVMLIFLKVCERDDRSKYQFRFMAKDLRKKMVF